jgi:hypothetical protein
MNGIGMYQYTNYAGSPQAAAQHLTDIGARWVIIKIGNGTSDAGATAATYTGAQAAAVKALAEAGLEVWGYHYVYGGVRWSADKGFYASGASPEQEADYANAWANGLAKSGLRGYVINAEGEYKGLNQAARAKRFMDRLAVTVPVALSTYRFPKLHPEFPWAAFYAGDKIGIHMPQVYWGDYAGASVAELTRCCAEYNAIKALPMVPTGRAYVGEGFTTLPASEMTAFIEECKRRGFSGCSFWSLDRTMTTTTGKNVIAGIKASPWPAPKPEPKPEPPPPVVDPLAELEQLVIGLSQDVALAWADAKLARADAEQARQTAVKADARAVVAQEQAEAARLTIAALAAEVQTLRHRLGLYDAWRTRPLE